MKYLFLSFLVAYFSLYNLAAIDGYYVKDSGRSNGDYQVFIQTLTVEDVPTRFALMFRPHREKNTLYYWGAFLKGEELGDGSTAWFHIYQNGSNLLSIPATFEPSYIMTKSAGGELHFEPTEFGNKIACRERIQVKSSTKASWESIPERGISLRTLDGVPGELTSQRLQAEFRFGRTPNNEGTLYTGDFVIQNFIQGIGLLRNFEYDSEAANGLALDREIIALVAAIKDSKRWSVRMIRPEPGKWACWSKVVDFRDR